MTPTAEKALGCVKRTNIDGIVEEIAAAPLLEPVVWHLKMVNRRIARGGHRHTIFCRHPPVDPEFDHGQVWLRCPSSYT